MMYRHPGPPREVVVGPFPLQLATLLPAFLLAGLAVVIGMLGLTALVWPMPTVVVQCTAGAGDVVSCVERKDGAVTQRHSAPRARVVSKTLSGKHPKTCVQIDDRFFACGPRSNDIVARARTLGPGQTLEVDNSEPRSWIGGGVAGALSLVLLLTAIPHGVGAIRRTRGARIRVTPQALEVLGTRGQTIVPRVAGEQVRVANVPKGRGGPPTACIAYGDSMTETPLVEVFTMSGVAELTPAADALRAALWETPRA